jgi:hypothetical protein
MQVGLIEGTLRYFRDLKFVQSTVVACQEQFLSELIEAHVVYLEPSLKETIRSDILQLGGMKI